jgi:uncharacterized protein YbjT (DUF2867 family)
MKVLVVGATGLTGQHLVKHLLTGAHEVSAMVRDPAKFTLRHDRLEVVKGDAREAASLEQAVAGKNAVLSALGPRSFKKDDLQEVYMRNLVAGMTKAGVKRLVNLSAMGAGDSYDGAPFVMKRILMPLFLGELFADKNRGEVYLLNSALDFVNVRPGRLTNASARGGVKASLNYSEVGSSIAREDLAQFMIAQLEDSTWVRKSPLIGY